MPKPALLAITPDNVDEFGIHCVADRKHPGRALKIAWFKQEYANGLRIALLVDENGKSIGFIEYAPGEHAWRAVEAPTYLVIHCLWVKAAGSGLGSRLIAYVVAEAKSQGRDGVAVVASSGTWCTDSRIYEKTGFEIVETWGETFMLCVKPVVSGAASPTFADCPAPPSTGRLEFRYSGQCPYVARCVDELPAEATARGVDLEVTEIATAAEARASPTPYGVTSLALGEKVLVDHAISRTRFRNILRQEGLP